MKLIWKDKGTYWKAQKEERIYTIEKAKKKFILKINGEEYDQSKDLAGLQKQALNHLKSHPITPGLWWKGPIANDDPDGKYKAMKWWAGKDISKNEKSGKTTYQWEIFRVIYAPDSGEEKVGRFGLYGEDIPNYLDFHHLEDALAKCSVLTHQINKNEAAVIAKAKKEGLHNIASARFERRGPKLPGDEIIKKTSPRTDVAKEKATPSKKTVPISKPEKQEAVAREVIEKVKGEKKKRGYQILGKASLGVIHWMGKSGFELEQAKKVLHKFGITQITDANLHYRLKAGANPARSNPADLSVDEQKQLREIAGLQTKKEKKK